MSDAAESWRKFEDEIALAADEEGARGALEALAEAIAPAWAMDLVEAQGVIPAQIKRTVWACVVAWAADEALKRAPRDGWRREYLDGVAAGGRAPSVVYAKTAIREHRQAEEGLARLLAADRARDAWPKTPEGDLPPS